MKAILMLEDGKIFSGESSGGQNERIGEVVLNTAVVGYQEMMTDPANSGKILILTYPLIGNYGIAPKFNESKKAWLCGLVIKNKTRIYSNWQAKSSFDDFIKKEDVLTISGVDTRTLAVHLRQKGQMLGIISTNNSKPQDLLAKIKAFKERPPESALPGISVNKFTPAGNPKGKKIAVLDLGLANSALRQLEALNLSITLVPFNRSAAEILKLKTAGLIISNGPENDPAIPGIIQMVKELIGKIPILGISTGHQVLAGALGARVVKMKIGHHGVNYPVSSGSCKGEITVQNHSWVVDIDSLGKIKNIKVTGFNLNDRTIEEFESKKLGLIGVQYLPVSPGFGEVNDIFKKFIKIAGK